MRILVAYRGIPGRRGWETGASMVRAFRQLGHDAQPWSKTYTRDEWWLPPWCPARADLLVYLECNDPEPQYDTTSLQCRKVYWEFDTAARCTDIGEWQAAQKFDRVFLANKRKIETGIFLPHANAPLRTAVPGSYLPYAFDPEMLKPVACARSGAATIGSAFPARQRFADALDIQLRTGLFGDDYARAISSLLVHVHHHDSGGAGLIVARPWETMGLGTCLLTQRTPELAELFKDGVHCVMYDDEVDAHAKLKLLFADPQRTMAIGERGRAEVLSKHTYLHRAQTILKALG